MDLIVIVTTALISALASGLVGVLLSTAYYRRHERRRQRYETLRHLMANRFDVMGDGFSQGLNESMVTYADSPRTMAVLRKFLRNRTNQGLSTLLRTMASEAGLPTKNLDDEMLQTAFNLRQP